MCSGFKNSFYIIIIAFLCCSFIIISSSSFIIKITNTYTRRTHSWCALACMLYVYVEGTFFFNNYNNNHDYTIYNNIELLC